MIQKVNVVLDLSKSVQMYTADEIKEIVGSALSLFGRTTNDAEQLGWTVESVEPVASGDAGGKG